MSIFRSIMAYAASKKYIAESQVFKGKLPLAKVRREEFTPEEYRKLHTFARGWIKKARTPLRPGIAPSSTISFSSCATPACARRRPRICAGATCHQDRRSRAQIRRPARARQGQVPQSGRRRQCRRLSRTHPRHRQGDRAGRFRVHDRGGQAGRHALSSADRRRF